MANVFLVLMGGGGAVVLKMVRISLGYELALSQPKRSRVKKRRKGNKRLTKF